MCGIAGIFSYSPYGNPIDRDELFNIRESMIHRGPDGAGIWMSESRDVGLAHRRLSIIDLSERGNQPLSVMDGKLIIVFNGEIYNYLELKKKLISVGYEFQTQTDTEVLLYMYHYYGKDMVHHLRGMYTFAIWDNKEQGLFLARDPFGIKPLYYIDDGKTMRFASQVKSLKRHAKTSINECPAGIIGYYLFGYVPEPFTLYKEIHALPAGHTLWIKKNSQTKLSEFFSLKEEIIQTKKECVSLYEILSDSVQHHLISDAPLGVFLSAGLDSTALLSIAASHQTSPLRTVTLGFEEFRNTEYDETHLAAKVAAEFQADHSIQWVKKQDFLEQASTIFHRMDQPSIDGVNTYFVSKIASEQGLKVALSGLGSDELFGGYPGFHQIPLLTKYIKPFSYFPVIGKSFRLISTNLFSRYTSPKYASLFEYGGSYEGAYLLRRGLFLPWELPVFLDADLVKEGMEKLAPLMRLNHSIQKLNHPRHIVSVLELQWYMRNQLLRDADWAGMAHSVEIRVPFVDINVFRSVMGLSRQQKAVTKKDMVDTLKKPLPATIRSRKKTGFRVPVQKWMMEQDNRYHGYGWRGWAQFCLDQFND